MKSSALVIEKTSVLGEKAKTEKGSGESKNKDEKLRMHPSCNNAMSISSKSTEALVPSCRISGSVSTGSLWKAAVPGPVGSKSYISTSKSAVSEKANKIGANQSKYCF